MAEEDEKVVDEEVAAMFDLKLKKKKKKKKVVAEESGEEDKGADASSAGAGKSTEIDGKAGGSGLSSEQEKPDYTYSTLLNRVVDLLHQNNPELSEKRRFTMKPPQLMRGKYSSLFFSLRKSAITSLGRGDTHT